MINDAHQRAVTQQQIERLKAFRARLHERLNQDIRPHDRIIFEAMLRGCDSTLGDLLQEVAVWDASHWNQGEHPHDQ